MTSDVLSQTVERNMTDEFEPACRHCKFARWVFTDNSTGRCKRFPPGLILGVGAGSHENRMDVKNVYVQQPLISRSDWCGEYQQGATLQVTFEAKEPESPRASP